MKSLVRTELIIVGLLLAIVVVAVVPALLQARREARDGIRRLELVALKGELERYFNEHNQYPLKFDASPHTYVVEETDNGGATRWYLRARLENKSAAKAGFDLEHNVFFRVVPLGKMTYYEICGGESHCGVVRDP